MQLICDDCGELIYNAIGCKNGCSLRTLVKLHKQLKQSKKTLEFYANKENYKAENQTIILDGGKLAREALDQKKE